MKTLSFRILPLLALCAVLFVCMPGPIVAQQEAAKKEPAPSGALGPVETLSGAIMMVEVDKRILIVKGAAGVPYSFVITPATKITAEKQRLKLADLASRVDQRVTVRFVPTRKGNIARSVELNP
ncbi:MAG: hypothetical protein ACPL88_08450 [Bryobacteraceae bacterium]